VRLWRRASLAAAVLVVLVASARSATAQLAPAEVGCTVRVWPIAYRAHDGLSRQALVVLPCWYGRRRHPPLPLVISPHGRGVTPQANASLWGDLPARGPFALVSPDGQGRRLELYSWGDPGQIADLARMPRIVRHALPWLEIDRRRIYAIGGSMGGQEVLLLVARHPRLLAGAAAFDPDTDLVRRWYDLPRLVDGQGLQELLGDEVGGPPWLERGAYRARSPIDFARRIAFSGVPLQIWWSTTDRIIRDQRREAARLYETIKALDPRAPVEALVGQWRHTREMTAVTRLPRALEHFGLLPPRRPLAPV
jgi:pimeloyl-ACP methyl ester carboxylesterase